MATEITNQEAPSIRHVSDNVNSKTFIIIRFVFTSPSCHIMMQPWKLTDSDALVGHVLDVRSAVLRLLVETDVAGIDETQAISGLIVEQHAVIPRRPQRAFP